jgi:hypothetical protein
MVLLITRRHRPTVPAGAGRAPNTSAWAERPSHWLTEALRRDAAIARLGADKEVERNGAIESTTSENEPRTQIQVHLRGRIHRLRWPLPLPRKTSRPRSCCYTNQQLDVDELFNRTVSVLERRFLLVSLLPTLIFGSGLFLLHSIVTNTLTVTIAQWGELPGSVQVAALLGILAAVWLIAGFLDSQLRNIVQLFEGYHLSRLFPSLAERAVAWHFQQRSRLQRQSQVTVSRLPDALAGHADPVPLPEGVERGSREPRGYTEESWIRYSGEEGEVLPTRLGNVIRAAEDYVQQRYGADYLKMWPRLAHVCSTRFIQDYELARSNMEFLLVICFYSGAFGVLGGIIQIVNKVPSGAFLLTTTACFVTCLISYNSAVEAAKEYGEQMRASADLYRTDLLVQLRYNPPENLVKERQIWEDLDDFIAMGTTRTADYATWPSPEITAQQNE